MGNQRLFIVIAAYNEATSIRDVVTRLLLTYPNIVVVDDGSTDGTWSQVEGLKIYRLRHVLNRGQGASLQTGIQFALGRGADIIVTFDADGQHHEKDIPALVNPLLAGDCDVCLGSRFLGTVHHLPVVRRLILKGGIWFTRIVSGVRVTDVHNGLRAFTRAAAESIDIEADRMTHASEILEHLTRQKLRFREVPVDVFYSKESLRKGQSSWNALRIAFEMLYKKVVG